MNNSYIPTILKDKINFFINSLISILLIFAAIFLFLSLFSFNINDDSFLTKTSQASSNIFGDVGSYIASFIFYTFGIMGYALVFFFCNFALQTFYNKKPSFFFIRLLIFFISLSLLPQLPLYLNLNYNFIEQIKTWGLFSEKLYFLHFNEITSYILSILGIFGFFFS